MRLVRYRTGSDVALGAVKDDGIVPLAALGGDYPTMLRANKQLRIMIAFVLILVYLVLASLFESFYQPVLIMIAVPLALVGAIAALTSKTNQVGFIGGMDIPLIRRFEMGFKAGAEAANKQVKILSQFVGSTSDAWKNPTKAKELAASQYQKKIDVIFAAAAFRAQSVNF